MNNQPKWINCKDSLPDLSEYCLVWDGDEVQKAALQQYPDKTKIWEIYHPVSSASDEPLEDVTHWMILPEPPKKKHPCKIDNQFFVEKA